MLLSACADIRLSLASVKALVCLGAACLGLLDMYIGWEMLLGGMMLKAAKVWCFFGLVGGFLVLGKGDLGATCQWL